MSGTRKLRDHNLIPWGLYTPSNVGKNYIYFSNTMKRRNHFKSNENSVYSNLQGNEEQTYGNLTAWDFPLYGRNSSLVAKIL